MRTSTVAWSAGPLQPLLELPGVTDVLVNGPRDVWVDRGAGLERADAGFGSEGEVRELAVRLAALGGRRLDDASPLVDARLPDGTRLHAVLPPLADGCAAISLRVVRVGAFAMRDLVLAGTCAPEIAAELTGLVAARASLLITGATGSGKTTLLASLLSAVDASERIVVIEEAGEVFPDHPHVVHLIERRANVDGAGAVGLPALVREALRMRPDRIVLGEFRGAEVREVFTALNTGHRGGMATMHANAPSDVPARLVALGALAGLGREATLLHAAAAFDAVVHLERAARGRRVAALAAVVSRDGALAVEPALTALDGVVSEGPGLAALRALTQTGDATADAPDSPRVAA